MRFWRFLLRRTIYMFFQLLGIVTIAFFLIRLIPGNPALALAGIGAREDTVRRIEERLGLDKPLPVQYLIYLQDLARGNMGNSVFTGQPVLADLQKRVPATLELITLSISIAVLIGVPLGLYIGAERRSGVGSKIVFGYGMLTGSLPDFWLGLILIFVFFFLLGWAPAPMGRFHPLGVPPSTVTGSLIIDSLLAGDSEALWISLRHLTLPVVTLVIIYMGNIVKMASSSMKGVMQSEFIDYARASGLPKRVITRYALRNALPPVVTVVAFTYGFLLGGAVLVEKVFAWGGLGEYAVQSITNSDYAPITGFVIVAGLMMVGIYLLLDVLYTLIDPRITY